MERSERVSRYVGEISQRAAAVMVPSNEDKNISDEENVKAVKLDYHLVKVLDGSF
jgi:hypothetical protein